MVNDIAIDAPPATARTSGAANHEIFRTSFSGNAVARLTQTSPIAAAVIFGLLYYAAVAAGFAFEFPGTTLPAVWPPCALLFAALMLTDSRRWWLLFLSFPAHFAAHRDVDLPLWRLAFELGLTWIIVAGAILSLRALNRDENPYSLRGLAMYLLVALLVALAPHGVNAWPVSSAPVPVLGWRTVYLSNVAAVLTMAPAFVLWATFGAQWVRRATLQKSAEVALIGLAILVAYTPAILDADSNAPVYLLLLPILWAAVRFGVAGAASAMFFATGLLAAIVVAPPRLLVGDVPMLGILDLQIFLIVSSLTGLIVSVLMAEREKTAEALQQRDERFQLVLRATNDVIFDWDVESGALWWSPDGDGSVHDSRLSNINDWIERVHEEDRERFTAAKDAVLASRDEVWEIELRVRRRDGSAMHVHVRASILRSPSGAALRMIGSQMDITDRKQLEDTDRKLQHAARLAAIGQITASIAHEINQPLGAILNNAEAGLLLLESGSINADEMKLLLLDVRNDDLRASEVIRRLRDLLQHHAQQHSRIDVNEIVREVAQFVAAEARRRCVRLDLQCAPTAPICGDRIQLQQVLLTLILNGMDALAGSANSRRQIRIQTGLRSDAMVQVQVSDSGGGIPAQHLPNIFDSFYTTKNDGMGLGLAIARSIIESHSGRIWAKNNEEGGGAVLQFELPVAPIQTQRHPERTQPLADDRAHRGSSFIRVRRPQGERPDARI